jgi:hypothetical protein
LNVALTIQFNNNMNDKLSELHQELAKVLLERVKDPDAKSADLNVARQFLKDNNIDAVPVKGSPLEELINQLPFNEEKSVIKN